LIPKTEHLIKSSGVDSRQKDGGILNGQRAIAAERFGVGDADEASHMGIFGFVEFEQFISLVRLEDRTVLRQLLYLDAFADYPAELVETRRKAAASPPGGLTIPPPAPSAFGIPDLSLADWVTRRMTPHPIATYEQPLALRNPMIGHGLPCTYIACSDPIYAPLEVYRQRVKGFMAAGLPWS
jgi:hypothetical protein